jgi:hypothetical protein
VRSARKDSTDLRIELAQAEARVKAQADTTREAAGTMP